MRLERTFSLYALFLLLCGFAISVLINIGRASAQQTPFSVIFVDKVSVIYNGETYTDVDPFDGNHNYRLNGKQGDCVSQIQVNDFDGSPTATYEEHHSGSLGGCSNEDNTKLKVAIDPTTLKLRQITAYRIDDDTIWLPVGLHDPGCDQLGTHDDSDWFDPGHDYFVRQPKTVDGKSNPDYQANSYDISPSIGNGVTAWITTEGNGQGTLSAVKKQDLCDRPQIDYGIVLAANGSATTPPSNVYGAVSKTPPGSSDKKKADSDAGVEDSCEAQSETLGWIMCPVIKLLDEASQWLEGQVQQLLTTPDPTSLKGSNGNGLEQAWSRIRNITLILVIPLMLVMVISTALGFSFVDAYTIKRAMPRLIIAVIGITLSFYIASFLVELTNSVGQSILGLLTAPFGGANATLSSMVSAGNSAGLTYAAGAVFIGLVATGVVSFMIILSFAFVTVVALLIGFVILTLRQLLILALIVAAPVAILLWILPNTDRGWKLWWGNFSKLLLMFPLIMALIAVGHDFAWIIAHTNAYSGVDDLLTELMVVIAFVAPFFFIPATFKMGGAMFGALAGFAAGTTRGLREGQAKVRGAKRAENWQKFRGGERFSGNNVFARATRRVGSGVGAGWKGRFGFGAAGVAGRTRVSREAAAAAMQDESLKQLMLSSDDGGAVMALSGGSREGAEQAADDLMRSWMDADPTLTAGAAQARRDQAFQAAAAVGFTKSKAQAAMSLSMQNKARSIVGGEAGQQLLRDGITRLHGNNTAAAAEAAQSAEYFARESGRSDLGGAWHNRIESMDDGFRRTGAYKVARGYTSSVQAHATDIVGRYHTALAGGDWAGAREAAAQMTSLRNAMGPDVTEGNKAILNQMFRDAGLDTGAAGSIDEQFGADIMNAQYAAGGGHGPVGAAPEDIARETAEIRQRAGLYDQGDPALRGVAPGTLPGTPPSDRRLKTNIILLGILDSGILIYRFQYIWSTTIYVGVMAQDLLETHPQAVSKDEFGYYRVDYAVLGLQMQTLEEWEKTHKPLVHQ